MSSTDTTSAPRTQYDICKTNGQYETVSAGEVCSIETAKDMGIAKKDRSSGYIRGYEDVKKFNQTTETVGRSLCSAEDESTARRHCILEHGVGFVRKQSDPSKCVTVSCPSNWQLKNGDCVKPLEDYIVSKRSKCDERWYDWFVTPNYHLGNKVYQQKPGYCYNACPSYHVPAVITDPVDDESAGATATNKDAFCANKNDYMGGKYAGTSDYCPLVWIKRLSSTPDTLKTDAANMFIKHESSIGGETNLNNEGVYLKNSTSETSTQIYNRINTMVENVDYNGNMKMINACRKIATPERLEEAYKICEQMKTSPDAFAARYTLDSEQLKNKKVTVIKQACNAIFCNELDDSSQIIGKQPICIPNPGKIDGEEIMKTNTVENVKEEPIEANTSYLLRSFQSGILWVLIALFVVSFIIFIRWFRVTLWNKVKCIFMKIITLNKYNCERTEEITSLKEQIDRYTKRLARMTTGK